MAQPARVLAPARPPATRARTRARSTRRRAPVRRARSQPSSGCLYQPTPDLISCQSQKHVTLAATWDAINACPPLRTSARHALVVVFRAELFEERERLGPRLNALHRSVGHVRGGLPLAVDGLHIRAFRDQVLNQ